MATFSVKLKADSGSKFVLFVETEQGKFGATHKSESASSYSSSWGSLSVVACPTGANYACTQWMPPVLFEGSERPLAKFLEEYSSYYTFEFYPLYTAGGAVSDGYGKLTVLDEYGTHDGVPNGTGSYGAGFEVGVRHTGEDSKHFFSGWRISSSKGEKSTVSVISQGGTSSNGVFRFGGDYDYAVVFRLPTDITETTTVEAVYVRKISVSFNANGGSGAPASAVSGSGERYTIPSTVPRKGTSTFKGWLAGGALYQPSQDVYLDDDIVFVAQWDEGGEEGGGEDEPQPTPPSGGGTSSGGYLSYDQGSGSLAYDAASGFLAYF